MTECPKCGEKAQVKYTFVETGTTGAHIPDDATDFCIYVGYHTEHEVEMNVYVH